MCNGAWRHSIAVMLLIPLSAAWNRILVVASPRRELVVRSWYLFPKTVRIPWSDIGGIQYGAEEMIHRSPRGGMITEHYWKWSVRLKSKSSEAPWFATFFPHKQPESPGAQARPLQQVARFIQWCLAHSRVSVSGPYLIEKTWERSGFRRGSKAVILGPTEQSGRHWGDWKDLNEGPVIHRKVTEKFVYEDENGVRRTFNSRDEIPPIFARRCRRRCRATPKRMFRSVLS
ncbi:MAG TPA: hypothetical protein ENN65_02445, partial [Candidatus Hydrogenedentes bacterium]|nr:hypothetical protein [Candidatus Hydrogenedentota bacterium]